MKLKKMISVGLIVGLSQAAWASDSKLTTIQPVSCSATIEVFGPADASGNRSMIETKSILPSDESLNLNQDSERVDTPDIVDGGLFQAKQATSDVDGRTYIFKAIQKVQNDLIEYFDIVLLKSENGSISVVSMDEETEMKTIRFKDEIHRHSRIHKTVVGNQSKNTVHRIYFQCNDKLKDSSLKGKAFELLHEMAPNFNNIGS